MTAHHRRRVLSIAIVVRYRIAVSTSHTRLPSDVALMGMIRVVRSVSQNGQTNAVISLVSLTQTLCVLV